MMDECCLESLLRVVIRGVAVNYKILAINEVENISITTFPTILIINTFERNNSIGHWTSIYLTRTRRNILAFWYCPLGKSPDYYGLKLPFSITWKSSIIHQPDNSNRCALYVLLFLHYMVRHVSASTIVKSIFERDNLCANEKRIIRFHRRLVRQSQLTRNFGPPIPSASTLCASIGFDVKKCFDEQSLDSTNVCQNSLNLA